MRYAGGKARLGKKIAAIVEQYRQPGQLYVEPFVGGCNTFAEVPGPKIGGDGNKYIAALWSAVAEGWRPGHRITREQYDLMRVAPVRFPPELIGFMMTACSFGGTYAGGFSDICNSNGQDGFRAGVSFLDYAEPRIRGARITAGDYRQFSDVRGAVIYCDPPYYNARAGYVGEFDSFKFFAWCRKMSGKNVVLVSEYAAPEDATEVAAWRVNKRLSPRCRAFVYERLFLFGKAESRQGVLI